MTVPSKTYYVSSLHGSADFDGLTPQTPFLHQAQVSALSLQPGDKVLLERGSVFAGEVLHLKNCGDIAGAPIEIGAYGTGDALPCIAANGTGVWYQDYGTPLDFDGHVYRGEVSSAVLLYDVEILCCGIWRSPTMRPLPTWKATALQTRWTAPAWRW